MSPDSQLWHKPTRPDHLTGTSHASANSRMLLNRGSHGTVSPLRVKETFGPLPTAPAGKCGGRDATGAMPGVSALPAPNTSLRICDAGTPHAFKPAVNSSRNEGGPQR